MSRTQPASYLRRAALEQAHKRIKAFRNAIEHGDEEILENPEGSGLSILLLTPTYFHVHNERIKYDELVMWINLVHKIASALTGQTAPAVEHDAADTTS